MKTSPLQRSLKKLRAEGWLCAITERWNQYAKVRQDLLGFIDILAVKGDITMGVQATSGDHVSHRVEKIVTLANAQTWAASPTRKIAVHGWRRAGARGKPKRWECRVVEIDPAWIERRIAVLNPPNLSCGDCDPCIGGRPDQCAIYPSPRDLLALFPI